MDKSAETDTIATAVKSVFADARLQTNWPEPTPEPPQPEPVQMAEWLRAFLDWLGRVADEIFWIALIGLAIFLAIKLVPYLRDLWRRRHAVVVADGPAIAREIRPAASPVRQDLLAQAEALARAGQFIEAIHILLLAAVDRLAHSGGTALPAAWTGRELFRQAAMAGPAREAFGTLLNVSERTHFGGRPADAEDYHACRTLFDRFLHGGVR